MPGIGVPAPAPRTGDGPTPGTLNDAGMRALRSGDLVAAERCFTDAAALDPTAPPLWMNLADACRRQGKDAGERDALIKALAIDAHHLGALIRLAQLHERRGEDAAAMQRWNAVVAIGAQMGERPPALDALIDHGVGFVRAAGDRFAAMIDTGLETMRSGADTGTTRRVDAAIDATLGRRRIYHNECAGLHVPFLPADEFFDRALFPWFAQLEAQTDVIRAELEALMAGEDAGLTPYVALDAGTPANKWSALDGSLAWTAYHLWRYGAPVAEAHRRCPATIAALDALPLADMPGRAPNVFFSILRPGTRLPAHTGVSNARAIVHLPLIVPQDCGLRVGGETRRWQVGEAFAFDDTIEHEAWNESDTLRAVLILDTWNPHLTGAERALLQRFFTVSNASGLDPNVMAAIGD